MATMKTKWSLEVSLDLAGLEAEVYSLEDTLNDLNPNVSPETAIRNADVWQPYASLNALSKELKWQVNWIYNSFRDDYSVSGWESPLTDEWCDFTMEPAWVNYNEQRMDR